MNSISDGINEGNLNVHLSIPIVSKKGIGLPFKYSLVYDSNIWNQFYGQNNAWNWRMTNGDGWKAPSETLVGWFTYYSQNMPAPDPCDEYVFYYHDPNGTVHTFAPMENMGGVPSCPQTESASALDGSGYVITATALNENSATNVSIKDAAGNTIVAPAGGYNGQVFNANGAGSVTDPNGNVISTDGSNFTDTLKDTVLTVSNGVYKYTGGSGSTSVTTKSSNHTVSTSFGCSGVLDFPATAVSLIDSISLPDGSSYSFTYDSTGRINQITSPTGGVTKYSYTGVNCSDGTPNKITKQVSSDGVNFFTWTYTRTGTPPATSTTTIVDPAQNNTVINFAYYDEILRKAYSGAASGTPKEQVTHCYNFSAPSACSTATGPTAAQSGTSPDALSILTSLDGGPNAEKVIYSPLFPTEVDLYDYGATTPTRKIFTPYGSWNGTSCAAVGDSISNRVCYRNVQDGSNYVSSTTYTYDGKGNLTAIGRNPLNGGAWQTTSYINYSNGALQQVTDTNGAITTYTSMACNGAFPQTITEPLSLTKTLTWNCGGGVLASVTDENGQVTTINKADPFWRTSSVTAPYNGTDTTTSYSYSQTTAESSLVFGSSTVDILSTVDGLGRLLSTQKMTGPKLGYDNLVQYGYGWNTTGATTTQTLPEEQTLRLTSMTPWGEGLASQMEAAESRVFRIQRTMY